MNGSLWFYSDTQQTYGPIAAPQLIAMIQAGQLVAGHFIMPQGAQEWQYISESPFAAYLPQAVPPPPEAALPPPPQSVPKPPQRVQGQAYRPPQRRVAAPVPQAVKKSRGGLMAAVVVLMLVAGGGAYFWLNPSSFKGGFPSATKEKPFVNSLGMKFVPVPGTDLLVCMHETRKQDFAAFAKDDPRVHDMWKSPTYGNSAVSTGDNHPVVCMSWYDADAFCDWLSKKEGRNYRLPTDREWCLAAGISDDLNAVEARDANSFPVERASNTSVADSPVMSLKPNKNGIFDLAGNIAEWCADALPTGGENQVLRGGMWDSLQGKSGFQQNGDGPTQHRPYTGFRCILAAAPLPVPEWKPIKRVDGCVSYNPATLKIVDRGDDGWLLTDGTVNLQLLDNEIDANFALSMAREHTQRCIVGRGGDVFTLEYWSGNSGLQGGAKSKKLPRR